MTSATLLTPARSSSRSGEAAPSSGSVRGDQRTYVRSLVVLDATVLSVAVLIGYAARFGESVPRGTHVPYVLFAPALVLAWLVSLKALRCYDDRVVGYGAD